jgi:hypothetical protein
VGRTRFAARPAKVARHPTVAGELEAAGFQRTRCTHSRATDPMIALLDRPVATTHSRRDQCARSATPGQHVPQTPLATRTLRCVILSRPSARIPRRANLIAVSTPASNRPSQFDRNSLMASLADVRGAPPRFLPTGNHPTRSSGSLRFGWSPFGGTHTPKTRLTLDAHRRKGKEARSLEALSTISPN